MDVIPTGNLLINRALGVGGFPCGRIVEVFGPESSGKTTLTLTVIAQAQKRGGLAAFIDVEHALSLDQWIRMRLRRILRKRDKHKGRGRGRDHNRYPNARFAERGLVFLIMITHDSAASPTK